MGASRRPVHFVRRNRDRDAMRDASVSLRIGESQRRFRRDPIIREADDRRYCEMYPTDRGDLAVDIMEIKSAFVA